MKGKKINIKTIIIIGAILIIISLISIILNMKNKSIIEQEIVKEQLGETSTDNAYITLEDHYSELNDKQQEIDNMQNTAGQATVTADKILKDYTAYKNGQLITGTMANNGAVSKTLNAGGSYTIPAGYHNGNGKVTANSLVSQTSATATANDIISGKTAWVNGELITGNAISGGKIAFSTFVQNDVTGIGTYVYDENSIEIQNSKFVVKKAGKLSIRIGTNFRYNSANNGSYGYNYLYVNNKNVSTAQGISIYYSTQLYTYDAQVGDTIYLKTTTCPGFAFAYYN